MLEMASIWQADTQQQNYRVILEAMSRPGTLQSLLGLEASGDAAVAVLATLLDGSVTLADPHGLLSDADRKLLQAGNDAASQADYILCSGRQTPDFQPKLGTLPSPEQSATLVVQVTKLGLGDLRLGLSGPGIRDYCESLVDGLSVEWIAHREDWVCGFPLGVDLVFVDDRQVMALPRTARVEVR